MTTTDKPNILNSADNGLVSPLARVRTARLSRRQGSGLFHEDSYTRILNRLLRTVWNIMETYRLLQDDEEVAPFARLMLRRHTEIGRTLVNMIIAHRGLPDDSLTLGGEAALFFLNATRVLPQGMLVRTRLGACGQFEKLLVRRYRRAIRIAPQRDVPTLKELRRSSLRNLERLRERINSSGPDDLA